MEPDDFIWRVSAYGIFQKDNKILMVQERWAKTWEFPGGGVHKDETIEQGLIREYKEETGLEVEVGKLLIIRDGWFYDEDHFQGWRTVRLFYQIKQSRGQIQKNGNNDDVMACQWKEKQEFTTQNTRANILEMLQEI